MLSRLSLPFCILLHILLTLASPTVTVHHTCTVTKVFTRTKCEAMCTVYKTARKTVKIFKTHTVTVTKYKPKSTRTITQDVLTTVTLAPYTVTTITTQGSLFTHTPLNPSFESGIANWTVTALSGSPHAYIESDPSASCQGPPGAPYGSCLALDGTSAAGWKAFAYTLMAWQSDLRPGFGYLMRMSVCEQYDVFTQNSECTFSLCIAEKAGDLATPGKSQCGPVAQAVEWSPRAVFAFFVSEDALVHAAGGVDFYAVYGGILMECSAGNRVLLVDDFRLEYFG